MNKLFPVFLIGSILYQCGEKNDSKEAQKNDPNFLIVFTDDQRYDAAGFNGNEAIHTPNMDSLAQTGMIFDNAFITTSISSPSRAALLTGRYGSANGVVQFGEVSLNKGETSFAQYLKEAGYQTGIVGKWHLKDVPASCGFDYAPHYFSNGPWYNRTVIENGEQKTAKGFIESYNARKAINFIDSASKNDSPFLLFLNTQIPHLDHNFNWDVREATLEKFYQNVNITLPKNWKDDLSDKPPYLKNSRSRQRAISYGYKSRDTLVNRIKRYYASITEMDAALGKVFDYLKKQGISDNTYVIFMGDNGWFLGSHMFTSKVLAYEESIHVPFFINGPGIKQGRNNELVLNIDVLPTLLDITGQDIPEKVHGKSLLPLLKDKSTPVWRDKFLYEAPISQLGSWPLWAIRTKKWKYIETHHINNRDSIAFEELYNLHSDPYEMENLADEEKHLELRNRFSRQIDSLKKHYNN